MRGAVSNPYVQLGGPLVIAGLGGVLGSWLVLLAGLALFAFAGVEQVRPRLRLVRDAQGLHIHFRGLAAPEVGGETPSIATPRPPPAPGAILRPSGLLTAYEKALQDHNSDESKRQRLRERVDNEFGGLTVRQASAVTEMLWHVYKNPFTEVPLLLNRTTEGSKAIAYFDLMPVSDVEIRGLDARIAMLHLRLSQMVTDTKNAAHQERA